MDKVRRGSPTGPLVTLGQNIAFEEGESNPKKWQVKDYFCDKCGGACHGRKPESVKTGFRSADVEATSRRSRSPRKSGWDHKDHAAAVDCPEKFKDNIQFLHFTKHYYDPQIRAKAEAVLDQPDIAEKNRRVLLKLLHKLYDDNEPRPEQIEDLEKRTKKKFAGMAMAATHPWLYPYYAALSEVNQLRMKRNGKGTYKVTFDFKHDENHDYEFEQKISFRGQDGTMRDEKVPRAIAICFVHPGSRKNHEFNPISYEDKPVYLYSVSKAAYERLAATDYDPIAETPLHKRSRMRDSRSGLLFTGREPKVSPFDSKLRNAFESLYADEPRREAAAVTESILPSTQSAAYKPWMHDEPRQQRSVPPPLPLSSQSETSGPQATVEPPSFKEPNDKDNSALPEGIAPPMANADDFQLTSPDISSDKVTRARKPKSTRLKSEQKVEKVNDSQMKLGLT